MRKTDAQAAIEQFNCSIQMPKRITRDCYFMRAARALPRQYLDQ